MPNKKHYWTQVFLVTTLVSCGLGFVTGTIWTVTEAHRTVAPTHSAYMPLEFALQQCTRSTYGPICPLAQPGARVIELEPYYANRIAAPPYNCDAWKNEPATVIVEETWDGTTVRLEGVPNPHGRNRYLNHSHSCHSLDLSTPAIMLPLLVLGTLICFRRKFFPSA